MADSGAGAAGDSLPACCADGWHVLSAGAGQRLLARTALHPEQRNRRDTWLILAECLLDYDIL